MEVIRVMERTLNVRVSGRAYRPTTTVVEKPLEIQSRSPANHNSSFGL